MSIYTQKKDEHDRRMLAAHMSLHPRLGMHSAMRMVGNDGLYHISQYHALPDAMRSHPDCLQSERWLDDVTSGNPQDNDVFISNSSFSSGYSRFTIRIFLCPPPELSGYQKHLWYEFDIPLPTPGRSGFGLFYSSQYGFCVRGRTASNDADTLIIDIFSKNFKDIGYIIYPKDKPQVYHVDVPSLGISVEAVKK